MLFAPLGAEESGALLVRPFWILVSIANFVVLLLVLRKVLWGPILTTLQTRADKIREGLEAAESARTERERMQQEVAQLLSEARREAAALSERTTRAAEAAAVEIRNEAKAEGDRIRERARADAEQLHQQALAQLRGEVANMAVLAASRIIGQEVDVDRHRALIERSLDDAGTQLGRAN